MLTPEHVFASVADRPGAVWLDGDSGWSVLAWDPVEVVAAPRDWVGEGRRLSRGAAGEAPFTEGCIGYVGFGAGHRVLPVPAGPPTEEPESWLARYDGALCFRHADHTWHPTGRRSASDVRGAPLPPVAPPDGRVVGTSLDREAWIQRVEAIRALLEAGDCYQVNLTRVVHVDGVADPFAAYRRVRGNHADRGAFLRPGDVAVLSNSPEVLLDVDGRRARSEPIKGTRPRRADPAEDAALAADLDESPKERAELTMIVDLVRNDLGRVAVAGSVVAGRRRVSPHGNVHHAAQAVEATLRDGLDAWDALAAAFPPGSVTGAPKVRACERIAEFEPAPRGVYCGAIGFASGPRARFNVAIRTAVWRRGALRYHVGGGIVHGSDPASEWEETIAKGSAMARAYAGVDRA